ncbi:Oligopeptide transporter 1 [Sesamum angolense]|uniref:Oligopeptide transporter 1 n=1 Tax=Sesamum angolense TaxID=2727404 RepID=A0AAE1WC15_9LAMI|nr:Oligopeptide transporter 1 [Sesamum angolense]
MARTSYEANERVERRVQTSRKQVRVLQPLFHFISLARIAFRDMESSDSSNTVPVSYEPTKPAVSGNATLETLDEVNDSPIEEVRLTIPITDDPTLPCLTFRTWVLGIISCATLGFLNQFFGYRQNALSVTSVSAQILVLPLGKLMAASLPRKEIHIPGTKWSFSLNPGPFNLKEHCLITIFANTGSNSVYAVNIITIVKAFYHRQLNPVAAMLLTHSTQMLGYGWAGIFRKFLVDSPYMWWPVNLVQVSLFRALHEQIGSGINGLGVGSFAFDWATVAGFLGSPLATPGFAIINMLVGFVLVLYVVTPIAYWNNFYNAKRFPIISSHVFDASGAKYNISAILTEKTFEFNHQGYDNYSKVNLSIFFVLTYGISFATLAATVSHVALLVTER